MLLGVKVGVKFEVVEVKEIKVKVEEGKDTDIIGKANKLKLVRVRG